MSNNCPKEYNTIAKEVEKNLYKGEDSALSSKSGKKFEQHFEIWISAKQTKTIGMKWFSGCLGGKSKEGAPHLEKLATKRWIVGIFF